MNPDGYPDDGELKIIATWDQSWDELMAYVKKLWWMPDWGWRQRGRRYWISTGGWSGNEALIDSMQKNFLFWGGCWHTSRRGGHYFFALPKKERKAKK